MRRMDPRNLEAAQAFLREKRIAFVGLSRNEKDFSRALFREFLKRGVDVVPVHPSMAEAEGRRCFARLQDVTPPVSAAFLMTHPLQAEAVLADGVAAGVRRVWFHRGAGKGSADAGALAFCAAHGIEVVRDLCPYMAIPGAGFPHSLHAWFRRRAP
jgi:predicted CoA-binding protein